MTYAAYTEMFQKNMMCECGGIANDKASGQQEKQGKECATHYSSNFFKFKIIYVNYKSLFLKMSTAKELYRMLQDPAGEYSLAAEQVCLRTQHSRFLKTTQDGS